MKNVSLLAVLLLVTATVTASAVFEYKHHQNVTSSAVVKAQKQRDSALSVATSYQSQLQAANSENSTLVTQQKTLCAALIKAKLTNPVCQ